MPKNLFYVEPLDEAVLSNPKQYIIDKGGYIFFAELGDDIVGTVTLMPIENKGLYEVNQNGCFTKT